MSSCSGDSKVVLGLGTLYFRVRVFTFRRDNMFRVLFNSSRRLCSGPVQFKSLPGKYNVDAVKLSGYHLSASAQSARSYCQSNPEPVSKRRLLPPLMAFQEVIWPSVFKSMRGFIFLHFIIRPYLDGEFNVKEFTTGAKQAVHIISSKLANGDWEGLKDFVADDILPELKESLSKMTVAQRSEVAIGKDDIYLTFPYQVFVHCPLIKQFNVIISLLRRSASYSTRRRSTGESSR